MIWPHRTFSTSCNEYGAALLERSSPLLSWVPPVRDGLDGATPILGVVPSAGDGEHVQEAHARPRPAPPRWLWAHRPGPASPGRREGRRGRAGGGQRPRWCGGPVGRAATASPPPT